MANPATVKARIGASTPGTMTFSTMPSPSMTLAPSATKAAPTTPPMRAWEELEGRPSHQVARFQVIAPMRPANTTVVVIASAWTIPLATVAATASEMKAPAKFRTADMATAKRGDMARVDTDVAMAFAVSWNPFVKSKASAVATTMTRTTSPDMSAVLDDDALERVRDVLGGVDGLFEPLEDVLPADHDHGVDAAVEERGDGVADDAVAVVLEPVDLDGVVADVLEVAQARHRLGDLPGRLEDDVGQPLGLLHRGLDAVEPEVVRHLVDEVDDVVERRGQLEDVLPVDRRDERRVQPLDDVVGDPVAGLLADDDVASQVGGLRVPPQHPVEQVGGLDRVGGRLLEEVEELPVLRGEDLGESG